MYTEVMASLLIDSSFNYKACPHFASRSAIWVISKHWLQYYSKGKAMVVFASQQWCSFPFIAFWGFLTVFPFSYLNFRKILRLPMFLWAWMVQTTSQKFRAVSLSVMSPLSARDILVHTLYSSCSALHACYSLRLQQLNLVKKIFLNTELVSGFWPHRNFVVILNDVSIVSKDQY